jgi:hypothetical protein
MWLSGNAKRQTVKSGLSGGRVEAGMSLRSTFTHWEHADSWKVERETLRELGVLDEPGEPDVICQGGNGNEQE